MQDLYIYERNLLEPEGEDPVPSFDEAVEQVVQSLTSSGDFSSATRPYSIVQNVKFDYADYDRKAHDVVGKLTISKALQSLYGDNADQETSYILTRKMMQEVAAKAPADVKTEVTRVMIAFNKVHDQMHRDSLKNMLNRLAKGHGRKIEAPQPARFRKSRPVSERPR